jgi:hypothetical protein
MQTAGKYNQITKFNDSDLKSMANDKLQVY